VGNKFLHVNNFYFFVFSLSLSSLDCGSQVKNSSFRNPNQNRAALWWIFSVRQPIGKQGSMQTVNRTSRRLESFLHEAAQKFELLSNIQDQKLKIKNI
jgi:hypothetical protein